jgi:uncharacterized OB-fold protein
MSDRMQIDDPVLWPYWEAAQRRSLVVQRCQACGHHQHYPRPFCLECDADTLEWVETKGQGTVHSVTTVHVQLLPELKPPYQVALIDLDEGPRLVTGIDGTPCTIGDRVTVTWREREGLPPLPNFTKAAP